MKQLFDTDAIIGKTVLNISEEYEERLIIVFTDETFIVISDDSDKWERNAMPEIAIKGEVFDTNPSRSNYKLLYKLGMISQYVFSELDPYFKQMDIDEEKEREQSKKAEEIHKLQQLAQKYPEIATLK